MCTLFVLHLDRITHLSEHAVEKCTPLAVEPTSDWFVVYFLPPKKSITFPRCEGSWWRLQQMASNFSRVYSGKLQVVQVSNQQYPRNNPLLLRTLAFDNCLRRWRCILMGLEQIQSGRCMSHLTRRLSIGDNYKLKRQFQRDDSDSSPSRGVRLPVSSRWWWNRGNRFHLVR